MAHGEIYVQLSVNFADDPKVRALARYGKDARRIRDLYVQMLCYCKANLTDGHVPADQIGILVYPDAPAIGKKDIVRLVEVGLVEARDEGWFVAGFLKRNKSREAIRDKAAAKAAAGAKANHTRWHVERGESKPDCELCQADSRTESEPDPKSDPKRNGSPRNAESPETETETETEVIGQRHRSETETQKRSESSSPPPTRPDAAPSEPAAPLPPEPQPDEDDDRSLDMINDRIEGRIIELLAELTGRTVDRVHASTVRRQLLDDRPVTNPLGYVSSCIRGEPKRYLPTNGAPWESPVPPLPPKDPDAYDHGAAEARKLLAAKLRKGAQ